jgi:hypothetical protein
MRANIIACLLAAGYFACVAVVDSRWKSERVRVRSEIEPPVDEQDRGDGPDAYKVAVLLSVAAAVVSSLFA